MLLRSKSRNSILYFMFEFQDTSIFLHKKSFHGIIMFLMLFHLPYIWSWSEFKYIFFPILRLECHKNHQRKLAEKWDKLIRRCFRKRISTRRNPKINISDKSNKPRKIYFSKSRRYKRNRKKLFSILSTYSSHKIKFRSDTLMPIFPHPSAL